ncbi:hypothetical protein [Bradyrhizobium sp. 142]|uniref:hypothetical protein n=1 Tax=Bradyrhizobium sp. 142 TaxID=2782618 RepID=UPI001FF980C8|nr:hypothetical protein [Bradyrhizobium sp. 142]MCK1724977.1 hypothetical protein [Bradyrhizobium sp. 142]
MTVADTIEELRAELRNCLFTPAERKALEAELTELIRLRDAALAAGEGVSPFSLLGFGGRRPRLFR